MTSQMLVFHHNVSEEEFDSTLLSHTSHGDLIEKVKKHLVPWFTEIHHDIDPDEIHIITSPRWYVRFVLSNNDVMVVNMD